MTRAVEKRFGRRAEIPTPRRRWLARRPAAAVQRRAAHLPAPATEPQPSAIRSAVYKRPHTDRLAGLDLLRLAAALAVVAFHLGYAGPMRGTMDTGFPDVAGIAKYGFIGVDLFFLISGFVIAASATGRSWHQFAVARALRLYPGYVVCMTATAAVLALAGHGPLRVTAQQWLANLTMVAPALGQPFMDGAYWSIVIELVFYGWVAVLVAAGIFERRLLAILTVWLAVSYLNEVVLQARVLRLGLCTEYAALFASGILIQRLRAGVRNPYAWALLGFAFGLGGLHAFEMQRIFARLYADTVSLPVLWLMHLGIYAVLVGGLWMSRWLPSSRSVLTIGGLTYPLYLVHQQVGYVLIDALAPELGRIEAVATVLMLLLAFAWAVYRWAEPAGRSAMKAILALPAALVPHRGPALTLR